MTKVALIGAGSWGTAMGVLLTRNGRCDVVLWARRPELAETMNLYHENPEYLPGIVLPDELRVTNDLEEALAGAETVIMGVPSHGFRDVLKHVAPIAGPRPAYVSLTKGLEVGTRKRMSEVIGEEVDGLDESCVAVLTGPNLAREIVEGHPSASAIASRDDATAKRLQGILQSPTFRCYTNNDIVGCEIGGAFKNVIAIAAGVADGLGFGDNTKASVMTRGLAEMARFSVRFGAHPLTFLGLAGVGDLIATCASPHSRNHYVGMELGRGRKIEDILGSMRMVAEGVRACKPIYELGQRAGVALPITEAVVGVCHNGRSVHEALMDLLAREIRSEFEGVDEYLFVKSP